MDLEEALILLYLFVNDGYRMVTFGSRLKLCGPGLSDVAVLTMEIFGEQQGRHDDASIHQYFDGHWRHFFPNLGSYQAFARQCAALSVMGVGCPEPDQAPPFGAGFPAEHRRPSGRFGICQ
jgi:hypothetical protein